MNPAEYETLFAVEDRHWRQAGMRALVFAALAGLPRDAAILDAGCGTGGFLDACVRSPRAPFPEALGCDRYPGALERCRRRGLRRLVRADLSALPFREGAFDAAISLDVLYHEWVRDPAQALRGLHRCLRPGGRLLLNLPAYPALFSAHDRAVLTARRFRRRETVRLLEAAGFEGIQARYWNTLLFPVIAAVRRWRRHDPGSQSDSALPPAWLNRALGGVLAAERGLGRLAPLPFGLSIFAAARRGG